jgi:hypothetical protein
MSNFSALPGRHRDRLGQDGLAMLTHWSPIRSAQRIKCSSAATIRRSPATGA